MRKIFSRSPSISEENNFKINIKHDQVTFSSFAIGAIGPMREIYVLKFGADVTGMAAAGFVVAF